MPRLLLLLLLGLLAATPAQAAEEVVWSALVYASNEQTPAPAPRELAPLSPKMQHIFGYNQFQLLGSHRETMDTPFEHWLIPGKGIYLLVDAKRANQNYMLTLQLFQEQRLAVRTVALLARQSPILLKGPQYGDGQLIIVIAVERTSATYPPFTPSAP